MFDGHRPNISTWQVPLAAQAVVPISCEPSRVALVPVSPSGLSVVYMLATAFIDCSDEHAVVAWGCVILYAAQSVRLAAMQDACLVAVVTRCYRPLACRGVNPVGAAPHRGVHPAAVTEVGLITGVWPGGCSNKTCAHVVLSEHDCSRC